MARSQCSWCARDALGLVHARARLVEQPSCLLTMDHAIMRHELSGRVASKLPLRKRPQRRKRSVDPITGRSRTGINISKIPVSALIQVNLQAFPHSATRRRARQRRYRCRCPAGRLPLRREETNMDGACLKPRRWSRAGSSSSWMAGSRSVARWDPPGPMSLRSLDIDQ